MAKFTHDDWVSAGVPRWAADFRSRDHLVPGGVKLNASQFPVEDAVTVTVSGAGAASGATAIPLSSAASGPIPNGTVLDFTGTGEFAKLTSAASKGATSLAVEALDAAVEAGDTATYTGQGKKFVPSGRAIVRDGNTFRPARSGDANADVFLLAFSVEDVSHDNDGVLYRPGSVVKENLLPNFSDLHADVLTALRRRYVMQPGGVA